MAAAKVTGIRLDDKMVQNLGAQLMSKDELIDCICEINKGASAEFLAGFSQEELSEYLEHLMELDIEQLVAAG